MSDMSLHWEGGLRTASLLDTSGGADAIPAAGPSPPHSLPSVSPNHGAERETITNTYIHSLFTIKSAMLLELPYIL